MRCQRVVNPSPEYEGSHHTLLDEFQTHDDDIFLGILNVHHIT